MAHLLQSRDGNSAYYNIDLKEIHIAGKQLPINPMVFDGKYGTILDSGTTYAYLPEPAFKAFKDAVRFSFIQFLLTLSVFPFDLSEFNFCLKSQKGAYPSLTQYLFMANDINKGTKLDSQFQHVADAFSQREG